MRDTARTVFLVCYDVCDPGRLYRVRRFLKGFRIGGQKSCFECWLTAAELRAVQRQLAALIVPEEDRVHIFQLDPRMKMECLGVASPPSPGVFMVL
ncbi:CRISPR-associated endonuclease Cas2 [uncultured Thiodictyon sp.]|uniref:CRISPR-associated endonuclease Cas2 n=1 Tax=uncultured Thiodictyon sp. TaxID=1846217 RepID=UPI0025FD6B4E|nr:CRISPR-associated endonuclease Cas2 [uncultured Thiodictyon sp.]